MKDDRLEQFKTKNHSFLFGRHVNQHPLFISIFDMIFEKFEFSRIIELGTFKGNLSVYFLLWAIQRNADFITYDVVDYEDSLLKRHLNFEDYFRKRDILFSLDEIAEECKEDGRTFLFCDNGNKIIEFNALSDKIKEGDIIAAHDWGVEIKEDDIETGGLVKIHEDKEAQLVFFMKL